MAYQDGQTFGRPKAHGHCGSKQSRTYTVWISMRVRCSNPKNKSYSDYGGRGIKVCDRWDESFQAFLSDMGEAPPGKYLDRINNDGDYEPENCRWATPVESGGNRRSTRLFDGMPLSRYAALHAAANGVSPEALRYLLGKRGLPLEAALKRLRERDRSRISS